MNPFIDLNKWIDKSLKKETPGPLNRKRSRKGSRGQRSQIGHICWISQTFCIPDSILDGFTQVRQDGLTPWLEKLLINWPYNPINHEAKGGENE